MASLFISGRWRGPRRGLQGALGQWTFPAELGGSALSLQPQDWWPGLRSLPSAPLSQSTRTARFCAPPGCVRAQRQALGRSTKGSLCAPSPPPRLFPDRGQEQGRGVRASGLQGAPRGQAGPENESCRVAFPCNVSPAGWGSEGPGPPQGRSD